MATNPKLKETLRTFLQCYGAGAFFDYQGYVVPAALDAPAAVSVNVSNADIYMGGDNLAAWDFDLTETSRLITGLKVNYQLIHPSGEYGATSFIYRSGAAENPPHNWAASDAGTYQGYLEEAYVQIGNQDRLLTVNCPGIRDQATAELLAKGIIRWRYKQRYVLTLQMNYKKLAVELLDNIGVTATVIPDYLHGKSWLVVGHRVQPPVRDMMPKLTLTLIENDDFPAPTELDEGDGAIDNTDWPVYDEGDGAIDNTGWQTIEKR